MKSSWFKPAVLDYVQWTCCNCLSGAFTAGIVEDVRELSHTLKGRIVTDLLYHDSIHEDEAIKSLNEVDFKKQKPIFMNGVIDPENIDEYIAFDGYRLWVRYCLK